jgi:hypothetical protein
MHLLAKIGLGLVGGAAVVAGGSYGIVKFEERRQHKKLVNELSKSPTIAQAIPALGRQGEQVTRAMGVNVDNPPQQQ